MSLELNQWLIKPITLILPLFLALSGAPNVSDAPAPTPIIEETKIEEPADVCSCVMYVRSRGVDFPQIGYAGNLKVNSLYPRVGGVVLLNYNGLHHLAFIEAVKEDGLHISEQNFHHDMKDDCPITRRVIPINDPHIIGYYSDVL